jgi:hypothetical protein
MRRFVTVPLGFVMGVGALALDLLLGAEEQFEFQGSTTPEEW